MGTYVWLYSGRNLAAVGNPSTPIYVGEFNSVYAYPGKQTVSIVEALWGGMIVAEMIEGGVSTATWWAAYPGCSTGDNNSSSLYGWRTFGTYNLFSDGPPAQYECGSHMGAGKPYPAGGGCALLLFNLDEYTAQPVSVRLSNAAGTHFTATQQTYDKAIYDLTKLYHFKGATTTALGTVGTTFTVTLPPWSVNLVTLQ